MVAVSDLLLSIASDKRELKALEQKLLEMLKSVSGIGSGRWKQEWENRRGEMEEELEMGAAKA